MKIGIIGAGDIGQAFASQAVKAGYDVIKFKSFRAGGANYAVIDNFKKLLSPQNVSPVK